MGVDGGANGSDPPGPPNRPTGPTGPTGPNGADEASATDGTPGANGTGAAGEGLGVREVGGALLSAVAAALVALAAAAVAALALGAAGRPTVPAALVPALGVAASVALGPALLGRAAGDLPAAGAADLKRRAAALADRRGVDATVRVVDLDAANCCLFGYREPTLVVSRRLAELDLTARDAAIRHALARGRGGAALATATAAPAALVEAAVRLGLGLVRGRGLDRTGARLAAARVTGAVLLAAVALPWAAAAAGDRLSVAGGRRRADATVGREGSGGPLADALAFADLASGGDAWPGALDRASLLPMAPPGVRSLRGTGRLETRIRRARLRAGVA